MKRGQLIAFALAGVCALCAVLVASTLMSRAPVKQVQLEEKIEATQVLVARADIALGDLTTPTSFRWQDWPRDAVSPNFVTRQNKGANAPNDFAGSIARAPILLGEPITESKLIKPGSGGVLSAILPPGMRAISTRIKEETAVGKLILPNDHVDVILTNRARSKNGQEEVTSSTLFRNIRVLAIGQQIGAQEGRKGAEGATATLELNPRQSEILALANSMGEISLALRSVADLNTDDTKDDGKSQKASNTVRVLRYGVKTRQYGVN